MVCSSVSIFGSGIASMTKDMPREQSSAVPFRQRPVRPSGVLWE
uniref:Uncharacterized protein n=1 Tax=Nelumbo nucifera TaxID=4432 RepID=A0A822ZY42_NELNU|nr:TPA_asm: hypothetical protein HUJ06_016775 [Nelumbo nucifera]